MKCCPKCLGTSGYQLKVRAVGWTIHTGDWETMDEKVSTTEDGLRMIADKTVRCLDCGKRTLTKKLRAA